MSVLVVEGSRLDHSKIRQVITSLSDEEIQQAFLPIPSKTTTGSTTTTRASDDTSTSTATATATTPTKQPLLKYKIQMMPCIYYHKDLKPVLS